MKRLKTVLLMLAMLLMGMLITAAAADFAPRNGIAYYRMASPASLIVECDGLEDALIMNTSGPRYGVATCETGKR